MTSGSEMIFLDLFWMYLLLGLQNKTNRQTRKLQVSIGIMLILQWEKIEFLIQVLVPEPFG